MNPKIMVVDDEASILSAIKYVIKQQGYEFCSACDGLEALEVFERESPDILILDVLLPGINGFEVARMLRNNGYETPILFLSAKGDIVDKSTGFSSGGDDYLVKPFNSVELVCRIEALLRRNSPAPNNENLTQNLVIRIGAIEIFRERYEIFVDGCPVDLTSREFELIAFMASHPGKVFTREELLKRVWGKKYEGYANSITVMVRKIREKIETNPAKPKHLLTVWGVGYRFVE